MTLLLQVAVILAAARVMRRVMVPVRQPAVIGEMFAGLLLGPSCFGWLAPRASAALFAESSLAPLNAVSQIGLVLFMFVVGIRVGAQRHGTPRLVATVTSAVSIAVPFALGALLAVAVHARLAPVGVAVGPFALFLGAAMSITAFPVLARVLVEHRLLTTELGLLAISCAAVDDVAGWLMLAAVMTLLDRGAGLDIAARVGLLALYVALMTLVVRPALARMRRRRAGHSADIALPLLLLLLSAVATESIGVHALFGAFFAGVIMPRDADVQSALVRQIEPLAVTLFVPLFFAYTGLRTSVQLINTPALWRDAALILTIAVAGKGGASMLAARTLGLPWRQAGALGALLNTRGLIELVILNIGLERGILSPTLFSMLVLMAIITTCMTSPIVQALLVGGGLEERERLERPAVGLAAGVDG